jgi:hypothetical protein
VVGEHQVGDQVVEHPFHRVPAVGVPRTGLVGQHRDAVQVPDLPRMGAVDLVPRGPVGGFDDRRAAGSEQPPDLDVQVCEPHRVPRREDHAFAVPDRLGEAVTGLAACIQDALGVHRDGAGSGARIGLESGASTHELEDLLGFERLEPGHAELLVRVAVVEQPDVAKHVVERMGDLGSGHGARTQAFEQLLVPHRTRRPAIIERRQASGVRSDNVHRSHRTRSVAMTRDKA